MEIQQLVAVLAATMSPQAEERKAAEALLNQHHATRGQIVNLFRVAVEESADATIRQMAAISFKNAAKKTWEGRDDKPSLLADEDKNTVRDNLLEAIARSPPHVRSQLEEAMKAIIHCDWPEKWPNLVPQVLTYLTSSDQLQVAAALRVARVLARKYEFKDEDDRKVLHAFVEATFPYLRNILESLIETDSPAPELAEMMKLILKTFWSSMYMDVPPLLTREEHFRGWMHAIHSLLVRPVPVAHMPADPDARKSWQWWKMKKWVMHIAYRLFNRYGDPQLCREASDVEFARRFEEHCAVPFLNGVLQNLSGFSQGAYIAPRVTNLMLQYVTEAMAHKHTWKALKPHVELIFLNVVFPLLCFDDEDEELWTDDPQEYVRKGYDIIEDMYSTRTAAVAFIHQLCKARPKDNLDMLMMHVLAVLNEYKQAHPAAPVPLARKVDGALLAIGTLSDILRGKKRYKSQLEAMLVAHVMPLFASPHGHLRSKAAYLAGTFADISFEGGAASGKGPTFFALLQQEINALSDPDLPVRVDAAVAIRNFLDAVEDEDLPTLKPLVPQLLERFLSLSQETDSEDLTFSLEALVERFGKDIAPYAVNVCAALSQQFWRIISEDEDDNNNDDDDGDVGPLGAYSVLRAMGTVLESISSIPQLLPQLEEILFPILDRYCSSEGADVFEEITQLITYLTYFGTGISPRMWALYPKLLDCLNEWALDYFDCVLMPVDNYISRGTDVFLGTQDPPLLELTNRALETALTADVDSEELACAPKLMGVILQHCKNRVDPCIGPYLSIALTRLYRCGKDEEMLRDALLVFIADALYYNPTLCVTQLTAAGALEQALDVLITAALAKKKNGKMKQFMSKRDKKILILGFSSLLTVPEAALPATNTSSFQILGRVACATVSVLIALKAQEDKSLNGNGATTDADSDAGGESGNESDEEESDDEEGDVLDEAAIQRLRNKAAKRAALVDDDEDDWSSGDEWWSDDEDEVQSPIDAISPYVYFAEALQAVQAGNPGRFSALTSVMDAGVQTAVQGMMQYAAELRSTQQQQQQQ